MSQAHILGFPRLGARRELIAALQRYWQDPGASESDLEQTGRALRAQHWAVQREAGLDWVTVGDFAWYDPMLQTLVELGALPSRFGFAPQSLTLRQHFEMARGNAAQPALETAHWFDTHCRYVVPEFDVDTPFCGNAHGLLAQVDAARAAGHAVKPVLIGPLTLLASGRVGAGLAHAITLLPRALQAYRRVLAALRERGIEWVQLDEPIFALDLDPVWRDAAHDAYAALADVAPKILLATYFGDVVERLPKLRRMPVAGLHIDLASAPEQVDTVLAHLPAHWILSCGVVDGRNVWRHDLDAGLQRLQTLQASLGERLWVASSCSLTHVPVDLVQETRLDTELRSWLAFAQQKCTEVGLLARALRSGRAPYAAVFDAASAALAARRQSARVHNQAVQRRVREFDACAARRTAPPAVRARAQEVRFNLPPLPTMVVGRLPHDHEAWRARAAFKDKRIGHLALLEATRAQIDRALAQQQACGLDVLVAGATEGDAWVESVAEQWGGYALTDHGWVQHQGAECHKPPLIYGDVYALQPVTVAWHTYAQARTDKPVKALLSGPVSLLQSAFVRDDQALAQTALQLALALRDEISALEAAGIGMIQLDEPGLQDGLPLKRRDRESNLAWVVRAFQAATGGAADATQIHLHLGAAGRAAEFDAADDVEMLAALAALDVDVLSLASRQAGPTWWRHLSRLAADDGAGPAIGGGLADPAVSSHELEQRIVQALAIVPARRLWIHPDPYWTAGDWTEMDGLLKRMVQVTQRTRAALTN